MTIVTSMVPTVNQDTLWNDLCESVWNQETVVDIQSFGVSLLAVERWFKHKAVAADQGTIRNWTLQLMGVVRARGVHEGSYGAAPEGTFSVVEEPDGYLQSESQYLRSMTPTQLSEAGDMAGFEMEVSGVTNSHPLYRFM